ncbi:DUF3662 and FHA domain-containing protein [Nesterenkonia sp.]|uniref:FhaA domain-containing protein n=1 Tax=Nesterenkonia sp. TaxID=704201 RepID=UPI00262BC501|nr:DUF3662 and FHA domain-containing protein [Nesterenkonia sp.]
MGLLDSLERGIERAVRGAFTGRGGGLGPVEIATAVRRHMDRESAQAAAGANVVPNLYKIRLSEADFAEAKKYGQALAEELCEEIIRHADSQGYTLLGPVKATFVKNTELKRGQMSIETQTDRDVDPAAAVSRPAHAPAAGPTATSALPSRGPRPPAPASSAAATIEYEGRALPLNQETTIVGRSSSADVTISDTGVSRQHLQIQRAGSRWFARDLGSTNGSYVNGEDLRSAETELHDGAVIALGNARLRFRLG